MEKDYIVIKRSTEPHERLKEHVAVKRHKKTGEIIFVSNTWVISKYGMIRKNLEGEVRQDVKVDKVNPLWEELMEKEGVRE